MPFLRKLSCKFNKLMFLLIISIGWVSKKGLEECPNTVGWLIFMALIGCFCFSQGILYLISPLDLLLWRVSAKTSQKDSLTAILWSPNHRNGWRSLQLLARINSLIIMKLMVWKNISNYFCFCTWFLAIIFWYFFWKWTMRSSAEKSEKLVWKLGLLWNQRQKSMIESENSLNHMQLITFLLWLSVWIILSISTCKWQSYNKREELSLLVLLIVFLTIHFVFSKNRTWLWRIEIHAGHDAKSSCSSFCLS